MCKPPSARPLCWPQDLVNGCSDRLDSVHGFSFMSDSAAGTTDHVRPLTNEHLKGRSRPCAWAAPLQDPGDLTLR